MVSGRWKDYLAFNRLERTGAAVLLVFCLIAGWLRAHWDQYFPSHEWEITEIMPEKSLQIEHDYSVWAEEADGSEVQGTNRKATGSAFGECLNSLINANDISLQLWQEIGFSSKQAQAMIKYRDAMGGFKSLSDLERSFLMNAERINALKPWLIFPENQEIIEPATQAPHENNPVETLILELNNADSIALLNVRGIGPFYAGKIVELRSKLGGFHNHDQLMELWKMDEEKLKAIRAQTTIDPQLIRKINVNEASEEALKQHPEISRHVARLIVNYRAQHGNYQSIEDLKKLDLMTSELYLKLEPYIEVQ